MQVDEVLVQLLEGKPDREEPFGDVHRQATGQAFPA